MLRRYIALIVLAMVVMCAQAGCRRANWWTSFDKKGFSKCNARHEYINGFYRNSNKGNSDYIHLLEQANCCTRPRPWIGSPSMTEIAVWERSFDRNHNWNSCPQGYFLQGLYRSESSRGRLNNIEEGKCTKPADHPPRYGHCYNEDVRSCFNGKRICKCDSGYFVVGLKRGGCDRLHCLDTFRCCKMRSRKDVLDEKFKVKTRVMDTTLWDMAYLAHYLGYGWSSGCRAQFVGEDFRRQGDLWRADKSGRCSGYKSNQRLSIIFRDWGFALKDIKFGRAVVTDLQPETIDEGPVYNLDSSPLQQTVERSETITKTVTHTTTSSWKQSHELGVEITYSPPDVTGGVGGSLSYKFGYESGSSTEDSSGNSQSRTFTVTSAKTLPPNSAAKWKIILSKTRRTISYTATIIPTFSAEFQGFLRWGGGYHKEKTNYHYRHRGSKKRRTVNYKFGSSSTPFYTALKRQRDNNMRPWLWNDMMSKRRYARRVIDRLIRESRYEFKLTGKFDDVSGKHVQVQWETIPVPAGQITTSNRKIVSQGRHTARAGPNDLPSPDLRVVEAAAAMLRLPQADEDDLEEADPALNQTSDPSAEINSTEDDINS